MCPILKRGDQTNPQNYCPISLLCILSKVVYKKVISFIRPQITQQLGFLKKSSSLTQLLVSCNEIYPSLDNIHPCDAIYLDFLKAFDSVPHNELLYKLWKMGITGPLWLWFRTYLTNWHHHVSITGISSKTLPV